LAAILKLELNGRFLLVRNLHHPNTFAPFGGVFKAYPMARTKLDELGFVEEVPERDVGDLSRDLRGYVPMQNIQSLLHWFESRKGRELYDQCLRRELREEFMEAHMPPDLADDIPRLSFEQVRTVEERPVLAVQGRFQYRRIEVYQLALEDPETGSSNERVLRSWFGRILGKDVVDVGLDELAAMRLATGEHLASSVQYLVSGIPSANPDPSPFSRYVDLGDAAELFRDFLSKGLSKLLSPLGTGVSIQLLHRVKKHYSRSLVGRLEINARPCVLKYYPDGNQYCEKEAWALARLRGVVAVPELLEHQAVPNGPAFMLMEMVDGRRLSSFATSEQRTLVPLVVREVLRLRDVVSSSYGEIVGEYEAVPNCEDLGRYVRAMVAHWKQNLDQLPPYQRVGGDFAPLVEWADVVVGDSARAPLWSALTDRPCLCHTDVKPDDVIIKQDAGEWQRPVLLDFDNVFAFVPEFDFCKFHMYLLKGGLTIPLDEYASMIADGADQPAVSAAMVLASLVSVYPYVLTRLVNWAIPLKAQETLDDVALVLRTLAMPRLFGLASRAG
jgi:hypothetical protein